MIAGSYQGLDVAMHDRGVAVITFTRPERMNAMTSGCGATSSRCSRWRSSTTRYAWS